MSTGTTTTTTTTTTPSNVPLPASGAEAARPAAGAPELGSQMQHQLDSLSRSILSKMLGAAGDGPTFQGLTLKAYPHISILRDAKTYDGKEVERTVKSMLNLSRFVNADYDSLGGANKEALIPGLTKLRELIISGLQQLGTDHSSLGQNAATAIGYDRLMAILSVHDLAKSELVAKAAEERLGCTDHDMALTALVADNFSALEGRLPQERIEPLRSIIADPVVGQFFEAPRAIGNFNAGRHLQGEAPRNLFLQSVRGVDAIRLAEFIADWSGVDGHTDPFGPVSLARSPGAIMGTANALQKLLEAGATSQDPASLYEEFSYPTATLSKLGLERASEGGKALTRIAFIGREHQQKDTSLATRNVGCLKEAFERLPKSLREQLVRELNADDLDLGMTPHTMADLRLKMSGGSPETPEVTTKAYEVFLLTLHRVIEDIRALRPTQSVITANLNTKIAGAKLADAIDPTSPSAAAAVANVAIKCTTDKQGVVSVDFGLRAAEPSLTHLPLVDLRSLPGDTFLVGGIGGGGDVYQAAAFAGDLKARGKKVPGVFSVRRGDISSAAQLTDVEVIDQKNQIVRIKPTTSGTIGSTSRLPEMGVAKATEIPVYLIFDNDSGRTLADKVTALAQHLNKTTGCSIDSIAGVDTGGDSLQPMGLGEHNASISTPDQDHTSLMALQSMSEFHTFSIVAGPGIDSPANFPDIAQRANAQIHKPTSKERGKAYSLYSGAGLGRDESVFSKTSLVCMQLNAPEGQPSGFRYVDGLPLAFRLNRENPWKAWVNFTNPMGDYLVMTAKEHVDAIRDRGE